MVLCKSLNCDYIIINGSDEGRLIETLRNKLTQYCSSVSMSGGRKVVNNDEARLYDTRFSPSCYEIPLSKSSLTTVRLFSL